MRFIAALLAVPRHITPLFGNLSLPESYLAVDLFFVLSGVVIANAYERELSAGMHALEFLRIRAIRLYPLYFLGMVLGVVASLAADNYGSIWKPALHSFMSLVLLPNSLDFLFPLNGPAWTLFLEVGINVVHVLTFSRLVDNRLIGLITSFALALVSCVVVHHSLNYGWTLKTFPVGIARVAFSFYVGVLIYRRYTCSGAHSGASRKGNAVPWLLVACVAATLVCRLPALLAPIFEIVAVTCIFPWLVLTAIRFQPTGFSARAFRLGGLSSYAIYVIHAPLGAFVLAVFRGSPKFNVVAFAPWTGIAFAVLLVPLCLAVDAFYDAPIRRVLGRILRVNGNARDTGNNERLKTG
jgi:peptidoglycan/LPS O-acetylase OafA/YrhL